MPSRAQPDARHLSVSCSDTLGGHDSEFARSHFGEGTENRRRQWGERGQAGARRAQHEDPETASAEILLKAQVLVRGHERIVLELRRVEQRTVIQVGPTPRVHALNAVSRK